jgi:hypothetical protein
MPKVVVAIAGRLDFNYQLRATDWIAIVLTGVYPSFAIYNEYVRTGAFFAIPARQF